MAQEFNKLNFEIEVINTDEVVLVDFWAPWCGPCGMLAPTIDELSREYAGKVKVGKVNVDEEGALASEYAVVSIPTVILFKNGKACERLVGVHSKDDYEDMLDKYI